MSLFSQKMSLVCGCILLIQGSTLLAQERTYVGSDGVTYRETTQTVYTQVPVTEVRQQSHTVYKQQVSTQLQPQTRFVCTPVTEYRWVSRLRGRWNPFVSPYWTHQLEPSTRWEQAAQTVHVPVSQLQWVPETRTVSTPVTTYRQAEQQVTTKVALNGISTVGGTTALAARPPAGNSVASRPIGGNAMKNDPPREGNWQPTSSR